MYSTVIEIKKNITGDALDRLRQTAESAFKNRAGSVKNSGTDAHTLIFKGEEKDYGCLDLGVAMLARAKGVLPSIDSWQWLGFDDPGENCDVLEAYAEPIR